MLLKRLHYCYWHWNAKYRLVSKTQHDSDKQNLKKKFEDVYKKISNTNNLVSKTAFNITVTKIENKIL